MVWHQVPPVQELKQHTLSVQHPNTLHLMHKQILSRSHILNLFVRILEDRQLFSMGSLFSILQSFLPSRLWRHNINRHLIGALLEALYITDRLQCLLNRGGYHPQSRCVALLFRYNQSLRLHCSNLGLPSRRPPELNMVHGKRPLISRQIIVVASCFLLSRFKYLRCPRTWLISKCRDRTQHQQWVETCLIPNSLPCQNLAPGRNILLRTPLRQEVDLLGLHLSGPASSQRKMVPHSIALAVIPVGRLVQLFDDRRL